MQKIIILFAVVAVTTLGIGYYIYNMPPKNLSGIAAEAKVSAEELMSLFEEDEQLANKSFLGKVIEVKGVVSEFIRSDDGSAQIILSSGSLMGGISCNMSGEDLAKSDVIPQNGQQIVIKGKCSGFLMDVVLERCVIVKSM